MYIKTNSLIIMRIYVLDIKILFIMINQKIILNHTYYYYYYCRNYYYYYYFYSKLHK